MTNGKYVLFILSWIWANVCAAQSLKYTHFDIEDGLPSSTVYNIYEDSKDRLWFCTDNGLALYDGAAFRVWNTNDGLKSNFILDIEECGEDSFWVSCYRSCVQLFVKDKPTESILKNTAVIKFHQFKNKIIEVNTAPYGNVYEKNGTVIGKFHAIGVLPLSSHFFYYYKDSLFIKNDIHSAPVFAQFPSVILAICKYDDSTAMVLTAKRLYLVSTTGNKKLLKDDLNLKEVMTTCYVDKYKRIWISNIATQLFYIENQNIIKTGKDLKIDGDLSVGCFLEDKAGNLWLASSDYGVFCVQSPYMVAYTFVNGLSGGSALSVLQGDDGKLIVGTRQHLFVQQDNTFQKYNKPATYDYKEIYPFDGKILLSAMKPTAELNKTKGIEPIAKNVLVDYNVCCFLSENLFYSIKQFDYSGKLVYTVYSRQLNKLYDDTLYFQSFNSRQHIKNTRLAANTVFMQHKICYLGMDMGLFVKNETTQKTYYYHDTAYTNNSVKSIIAYKDSVYVFFSHYAMILYKDKVVRKTTDMGGIKLKDVKAAGIEGRNLFVVKEDGLYLYYEGQNYFFNSSNGLLSNEINHLSYNKKYNTLWIATVKGVNGIDLNLLKNFSFVPPKLSIMRIGKYGTERVNDTKTLYFLQNENYLDIILSPNNYTDIRSIVYYYKIDQQSEWTKTDRNQLLLAALASGEHRLQFAAKTNNSHLSPVVERHIFIDYPFYRKWWFYGLVMSGVVAVVSLFFMYRLYLSRKAAAEKEKLTLQIYDLKQQGLAASMNPHFIFNALNSIQYFVNNQDMLSANEYLANFAKLIRMYLASSFDAHITLSEEIKRIELYLSIEKMRFGDKLQYTIIFPQNTDLTKINLPTMFVQPFIENAILHGILPNKKGKIEVAFVLSEAALTIYIKDDGIGIEKAKAIKQSNHVSYAMKVIKDRIQLLKEKQNTDISLSIYDARQTGYAETGTVVELNIPLSS